jgi:hypothetical protein
VHQLSTNPEKWLHQFPPRLLRHGHRGRGAPLTGTEWRKVREYFSEAHVINMTATALPWGRAGDRRRPRLPLPVQESDLQRVHKTHHGILRRHRQSLSSPRRARRKSTGSTKSLR